MKKTNYTNSKPAGPGLFSVIGPYKIQIALLVILTVVAQGLGLILPKLIATGIDSYSAGTFAPNIFVVEFLAITLGVLIFTYIQSVMQAYVSEKAARDLRNKLSHKISEQDNATVQALTPAKLLTNLTSDIDAVKLFVSQAIPAIITSLVLIIGASALLITIDWQLALVVLAIVPVIGATFYTIFGKIRKLFIRAQEAIDWLNRVINESILGSSLIRLLNAQNSEFQKFVSANTEAKDIGLSILKLFASLLPIVSFLANVATLSILLLGGHYVITGRMTLGDFSAFNNYLLILIFPIFLLGFTSNVIAQAAASYARIRGILDKKEEARKGDIQAMPGGGLELAEVAVRYGEKFALKDVSLAIKPKTKTAIIGPTAAGKTQLLYLLTGLIEPTSGRIQYGGKALAEYDPVSLHQQIAFVFQDSVIFNLSLRENIAFSATVGDEDLRKAVATAELSDFISALPKGLDTVVSERGTSLSGGQKQRIMLARALALNPSVLLLDDFTARVDVNTEKRILENVHRNYPDLTLISVTQKVSAVQDYDQIVVLMEGELLAKGKHEQLMASCPEYVQIFESQRSTSTYEIHPE